MLSLPQIDWDALYHHPWQENRGDGPDKADPEFWHKRAADFADKVHRPESRRANEAFLDLFSWDPGESVLDVGAGPGGFAIPLSRRVKRVTAIDSSAAMLTQLEKQAKREDCGPIPTMTWRWLDLPAPEPHDTVLCLNALGVVALAADGSCHLEVALDKLRAAAKRRGMILIPHADSPADEPMRAALALPAIGLERRRVSLLYLAMVDRGFLPDVRILRRPFTWTFIDVEEAVQTMARRLGLSDPDQQQCLRAHLEGRLERVDGRLLLRQEIAQALFTWQTAAV